MKLFLTSLSKILMTSLLVLGSSSVFAKTFQTELIVTGSGSTCEEATREVMREMSYLDAPGVVTGITLSNCQSPDMAHVEKSAIIKLTVPEN